MSLLQGTVSLFRFLVLGPWPGEEEAARNLLADRFRPFESGTEDQRVGVGRLEEPSQPS